MEQFIFISIKTQRLDAYENDKIHRSYQVSTAKNGPGEKQNSECTPRGWHRIHACIGKDNEANSVFVARQWTGEIYSTSLAKQYPERDWILTRIIQLDGMEPGRNKGGDVDTLARYIYLHGTPDETILGQPGSHGCIRMHNLDIIYLTNWVNIDTPVYIE